MNGYDYSDWYRSDKTQTCVTYAHLADGTPVTGVYNLDDYECGRGAPWTVRCEWMGMHFDTDGQRSINTSMRGDSSGDIMFTDWAILREAMSANVIEQLVAIALRFMQEPALPSQPPAPSAADLERAHFQAQLKQLWEELEKLPEAEREQVRVEMWQEMQQAGL